MIIAGLTGGIGSGKTTVAKWFAENGIPVYNADNEAKSLMNNDKGLKLKLTSLFGKEAYQDGIYNRAYVSSLVFKNPELLKKLNAIVHPAVFKHFNDWLKVQKADFIVKEAAILFESGSWKDCDFIISVVADEQTRIRRVTERDGLTAEQVADRIKNQWTDEMRIEKSDYIIDNNLDLNHLKTGFERVYKELLIKSAKG